MRRASATLALLCTLGGAGTARADLVLLDGDEVIEGVVRSERDAIVAVEVESGCIFVPRHRVVRIERRPWISRDVRPVPVPVPVSVPDVAVAFAAAAPEPPAPSALERAEALTRPSDFEAERALEALLAGASGPAEARLAGRLFALAGPENRPAVRVRAIQALGALAGERAVGMLAALAGDGEPLDVRAAALRALAPLEPDEAREALLAAMADPSPAMRAAACRAAALGAPHRRALIPRLIEALRDASEVARPARFALARLAGTDAPASYKAWRAWWREEEGTS